MLTFSPCTPSSKQESCSGVLECRMKLSIGEATGALWVPVEGVPAWKREPAVYLGLSSSQGEFCSQGVREGLIVGFIRSMCQMAQSFCDNPGEKGGATPPALLLLLSRLCLDYETATISYILTLTDEQFLVQVNC